MRVRLALLALSSLPLITACSFLLDFDRLQGGEKPAADASSDAPSDVADDPTGAAGDNGAADSGTSHDGGTADGGTADASACNAGADARCDHCQLYTDDGRSSWNPPVAVSPLQLAARATLL